MIRLTPTEYGRAALMEHAPELVGATGEASSLRPTGRIADSLAYASLHPRPCRSEGASPSLSSGLLPGAQPRSAQTLLLGQQWVSLWRRAFRLCIDAGPRCLNSVTQSLCVPPPLAPSSFCAAPQQVPLNGTQSASTPPPKSRGRLWATPLFSFSSRALPPSTRHVLQGERRGPSRFLVWIYEAFVLVYCYFFLLPSGTLP